MSQYKIFKHPNEDIQSVKQGFCWPAYFFQWAWAIVSGIFVLLIFWFFSNATLSKIFSQYPNLSSADYALWGAFIIFWAIITTIPGFKANAWREKNLLSRGYELKEIITDKSKWGVITLSLKTIKSYLKGSAGKTAKIANFTGDKNLENNAYKIFLTKKYLIEKNEALGQFISQDELFNTIEEALEYANNLESEAAKIKEIKSNEALLKVKERVGYVRDNLHEAIDGLEHRVKEKINTDTKNRLVEMLLALKSFVSILFGHIKNGVDIAITKIDSKNSLTVENKSRVVTFVSYAIVLVAIGIVHDVFDDSPLYVSQGSPNINPISYSPNKSNTTNVPTASNYSENVSYKHFSDASCKPSNKVVCLTAEQYKTICNESVGISERGIRVQSVMAPYVEKTLLEGGSVDRIKVEWATSNSGTEQCYASVTVSGIVDGNSMRKVIDGIATSFIKSHDGEILVDFFGW